MFMSEETSTIVHWFPFVQSYAMSLSHLQFHYKIQCIIDTWQGSNPEALAVSPIFLYTIFKSFILYWMVSSVFDGKPKSCSLLLIIDHIPFFWVVFFSIASCTSGWAQIAIGASTSASAHSARGFLFFFTFCGACVGCGVDMMSLVLLINSNEINLINKKRIEKPKIRLNQRYLIAQVYTADWSKMAYDTWYLNDPEVVITKGHWGHTYQRRLKLACPHGG